MTKFSKAVLVFLLLCASQLVAANPPTIACGSYRVAPPDTCNSFRQPYDTNGNPVGGIQPMQYVQNGYQQGYNQNQWQNLLAQQAIRAPFGQQPQGYCSWSGYAENAAIGGLLGAAAGAIAGDNRQAVRKGFLIGAAMGLFVPCATLQQQQVAMQQVQQAVVSQQQFTSSTNGVQSCSDVVVDFVPGCYTKEWLNNHTRYVTVNGQGGYFTPAKIATFRRNN